MKKFVKKAFCVALCGAVVASLASCSANSEKTVEGVFMDNSKISYSQDYHELKDNKTNKDKHWRHGMVSGNGMQGFVESGSPYNDTFIFQNMHFILPNENPRTCPESFEQLEEVKQKITNGEDIVDDMPYLDVYAYHPGGQLRLAMDKGSEKDYMRYTDYASSIIGVKYANKDGAWERKSFTSMDDGAVITEIASSSTGAKVNVTLSYDDISTLAKFGDGVEKDLKYKKLTAEDGSYLSMVAHYQNYENSELKNGGYSSTTYVVAVDGNKEVVDLEKKMDESQFSGDNKGIKITDATAVYLITISDRTYDMCAYDDFEAQTEFALVNDLVARTKAIAIKYDNNGAFDFEKAFNNHKALYEKEFNNVTLSLEDSTLSNEALLSKQKGAKAIDAATAQRTYYAGRYAYVCCAGYATSRLYGMWTGEFNTGWGSKYTMDANVNLQTSSLNTSNIPSAVKGYTYFLLRQLPDWEENAYACYGFKDAIQAPVNSDGDKAIIVETCYPYPFRYWNAGTSWMIEPLYESLLTYGNMQIPLSNEFDLNNLKSVLSLTDAQIAKYQKQGYMMLEEDILLPMLKKSANFWMQLMTPEYYTDANGKLNYEKGKTELKDGESYSIVPSYSPENNPSNYPSPSDANCAIDISACMSNFDMLLDVMKDVEPNADTKAYEEFKSHIPPYLYDETGAIKEWCTTSFEENNEHRHLSHLYCAWPMFETQENEELRQACIQAVANRTSENEASHALIHRSLIAARLKDRDALSKALLKLMNHKIRYDSLMTNHDYDRGSCYCTDFTLGYLGIVNESLVYSYLGDIEVLPTLATTGFDKGEITGVKARTRATVDSLKWDTQAKTATVTITSDVDQTIKVSCGLSKDSQEVTFKANETKTIDFILE